MTDNPVTWSPGIDRLENSGMYRFMTEQGFESYADLYQWSIDNPADY